MRQAPPGRVALVPLSARVADRAPDTVRDRGGQAAQADRKDSVMPGVNFNAPEEFLEKLKAHMVENGLDNQSAFIREALEAAMEPKTLMDTIGRGDPELAGQAAETIASMQETISRQQERLSEGSKPTPAAAAEIILGLLPENQ